jgi:dCMP deaminase
MSHSKYSWDEYYMTMAYLISMKSKDPSTRVGAVIVGPDYEVRASGYNGLPRGIADRPERYEDKEYKYMACNHAEENAILHCARIGVSTRGCSMYVPWLPCARCAKAIIQSGIKEIIYDPKFPGNHEHHQENWMRSMEISHEILVEADVAVREFHGDLINIDGLYRGKQFNPFMA